MTTAQRLLVQQFYENPFESAKRTQALQDQAAAARAQSEASTMNTWLIVGAVIIAAALIAWGIRGRQQPANSPPPPAEPER